MLQYVLDFAISHLLQQGKQSRNNCKCLYRNPQPDGTVDKCAIGVLIDDPQYERTMESGGVISVLCRFDWPLSSDPAINAVLTKAQEEMKYITSLLGYPLQDGMTVLNVVPNTTVALRFLMRLQQAHDLAEGENFRSKLLFLGKEIAKDFNLEWKFS